MKNSHHCCTDNAESNPPGRSIEWMGNVLYRVNGEASDRPKKKISL